MTATNHGLSGAVIAIVLQKYPTVAIAIAPFSHILLDAIPHFGMPESELRTKRFFRRLGLDAALAVASTLYIAWSWPHIALLVVACAFLAASPDLMWIYYQYAGRKYKSKHLIPKFHSWIQWSQSNHGFIVEAVVFSILFPTLVYIGYATT